MDVTSANFWRLWLGQGLAQGATQLAQVAMPVIAISILHATEAEVGYLNAASTLAFLLVGLPAGAWVDRWLKRRTMIAADAVRALTACAVPVLWWFDLLQVWHLYVVALVMGIATVFFDVAYQSFIPFVVPKDQIGRANGRLETTSQVARLAGPAAGGLLLKVISAPLLLIADVVGYLASLVFLLVTRDEEASRRSAAPVVRRPLLSEIGEGISFVVREPALRLITSSTALSNLAATVFFVAHPLLVLRTLGFDGFALGVLSTMGGLGGLAGAMLTSRLVARWGEKPTILRGMLIAWLGIMVTASASGFKGPTAFIVLCVGEFVMTAGVLIYNITQVSMRQRLCPENLLGRMNASIRFVVWGIMPIASVLGGWISGWLGIPTTMWVSALLSLVAVIPLLALQKVNVNTASTS